MADALSDFQRLLSIAERARDRLRRLRMRLQKEQLNKTIKAGHRIESWVLAPSDKLLVEALGNFATLIRNTRSEIRRRQRYKEIMNSGINGLSPLTWLCRELFLHLIAQHYDGKRQQWTVIREIAEILDNKVPEAAIALNDYPAESFYPRDTKLGKRILDRCFKSTKHRNQQIRFYRQFYPCSE